MSVAEDTHGDRPQKRCAHCKQTMAADLLHFSARADVPSGLSSWCRQCQNESQKLRHQIDPQLARRKAERTLLTRRKLMLTVLEFYSNGIPMCACCSETKLEFLSMDHVNGGGNAHRRQQGASGGAWLYYWLRKNGYPPGFQVLCYNCNLAKGFHGQCPHQNQPQPKLMALFS